MRLIDGNPDRRRPANMACARKPSEPLFPDVRLMDALRSLAGWGEPSVVMDGAIVPVFEFAALDALRQRFGENGKEELTTTRLLWTVPAQEAGEDAADNETRFTYWRSTQQPAMEALHVLERPRHPRTSSGIILAMPPEERRDRDPSLASPRRFTAMDGRTAPCLCDSRQRLAGDVW